MPRKAATAEPLPLPRFTRTQLRMLRVLADGERHSKQELHACLEDELGKLSNIEPHLSAARKVLRLHGQTIVCEFYQRRWYYRHIVLLTSLHSIIPSDTA